MRSFQKQLSEFERRGVRLVAVTVDPVETTREHVRKLGLTYAFLSDSERKVTRLYNIVHAGAGPDGSDIPRPAEFLIDPTGTIRWANFTEDYRIRARPEQVLRIMDELAARPGKSM